MNTCRYFVVECAYLLLFLGGFWILAVISWRALDGCRYFVLHSEWSLLFLGALWMVAAISSCSSSAGCSSGTLEAEITVAGTLSPFDRV